MSSPNNTFLIAGIVDAAGNIWSINAAGAVCVNYVADASTKNVVQLAYVNSDIWQQAYIPSTKQLLWWYKTAPTAAWLPTSGTATSPLPTVPGAPTGVTAG